MILARGLGTRLRAESDAELTPEQNSAASAGIKAMVPVAGNHTMLDLIIGNLRDAGFEEFVIVIGDEHGVIRDHCAARGYAARFAVQKEPLGTADAVLAAESSVGPHELFLVVNSDNLYPADSLRRLRTANRQAMIGFARAALIAGSNIPPERIAKFATIGTDDAGQLTNVIEKPGTIAPDSLVSMNAWLFSPAIFEACRAIGPSARGEFEITAAVQYAIERLGESFDVIRSDEGVPDLSNRTDVASLERLLNGS